MELITTTKFSQSTLGFDGHKTIVSAPPNQSLKLTEPAVSFSPRARKIFKEKAMPAARIVCMELVARRRSLAPVR